MMTIFHVITYPRDMLRHLLTTLLLCFASVVYAQPGFGIAWERSLGGTLNEEGRGICRVPAGTLIVGSTFSTDADVSGPYGLQDIWCVALNDVGALLWQTCLGGSSVDRGMAIAPYPDGGSVLVGESQSTDGLLTGGQGGLDVWVVRLDATGELLWQRNFGGTDGDGAFAVKTTPDGGVMVAGHTRSDDGDVVGHHGDAGTSDLWVLRLSQSGDLLWQRTLGGGGNELGYGLHVLEDGSAWVVGEANSTDGDVVNLHGLRDAWVCRLEADGEVRWCKALGGTRDDIAYDLAPLPDGGALIVGSTLSNDGDVSGLHNAMDAWVFRLSATGGILWQRPLGGSLNERFNSILGTGPNSYLLAGRTTSSNGNVSIGLGGEDLWIVFVDASGTLFWEGVLGGSSNDRAWGMSSSPGGGVTLIGGSSSVDGDVSDPIGGIDVWAVELSDRTGVTSLEQASFHLHPNPASGTVQIELQDAAGSSLRLFDAYGRLHVQEQVRSAQLSIDVQHLPPGAYVVMLDGPRRSFSRTLLVE